MLEIPILAGSAAYAMGEARNWRASLAATPKQAPRLYAAIALATVGGILLNLFHVNPIRALVWAAILNGIAAGPVAALVVHMASNRNIMGTFIIPKPMRVMGWATVIAMGGVCIGAFAAWF